MSSGEHSAHSHDDPAASNRGGAHPIEHVFETIVFAGRWIQAPLYGGLIVAELLYAYKFLAELFEMVRHIQQLEETIFMLGVLSDPRRPRHHQDQARGVADRHLQHPPAQGVRGRRERIARAHQVEDFYSHDFPRVGHSSRLDRQTDAERPEALIDPCRASHHLSTLPIQCLLGIE